jgi:hypothetical protein
MHGYCVSLYVSLRPAPASYLALQDVENEFRYFINRIEAEDHSGRYINELDHGLPIIEGIIPVWR